MIKRVKMAIKCLLGRNIVDPVTTHEYRLHIDEEGRFVGQNVIVTGGTGAIGSAICYRLAAMGACVGVCGRSLHKIESMIEMIRKDDKDIAEKLIPLVFDINDDIQMEEQIDKFVAENGKVDVLINNAGGQPGRVGEYSKYLSEQSVEMIDMVLDTNLRGSIMCSRIVEKHMMKQKYGHIINMSSVIGIGGKAGYCDYAATKAAIIGFTKSMALEMSAFGGRVNCISPGLVNQTPFDGGSPIRETDKTALKRAGYTKEVADAVVFLMSDEFITGQNIVVDGGRSLGLFGDE